MKFVDTVTSKLEIRNSSGAVYQTMEAWEDAM
jgi:hypothetical protein